ncbi:NAD(P)-binding protein [Coccomyxa subellipsoidea C-169]|uniref:NAD(P)-binding protein n=1 Tax=Coccomyxa subellipsoidea (strain C-169) TaxID=574566 RepID=I0ZA91_COCSC|nr:NAD(P)-binding protein [Coccomyxa subellipsoidea C-169]EIE27560.1 NAD(P)-binding protein [Coccomyxa subellipsoidea C-169]|eukprot:XP_005652104.1 NAD(P)-binding protein [Coccomyxa subellipsoidea C-169]
MRCTASFSTAPPTAQSNGRTALVQGASRGLGLEFVRQLLDHCHFLLYRVIAACRNPDQATQLAELQASSSGRLDLVQLDCTNEASIARAAAQVSAKHKHLDLLLNVAGILHIPGKMSPETALSRVTASNLLENFQINALGPTLVSKIECPMIVAEKLSVIYRERPAVIANLSARVGSIGDNSLGGWYSYRASKSAQNQLSKCMSVEFARRKQNVAVVMLHPGTVDTDLSMPFQKNVKPEKLFTRERAVKQLLDIVDKVTMDDNGRFIAWDGQEIPF